MNTQKKSPLFFYICWHDFEAPCCVGEMSFCILSILTFKSLLYVLLFYLEGLLIFRASKLHLKIYKTPDAPVNCKAKTVQSDKYFVPDIIIV